MKLNKLSWDTFFYLQNLSKVKVNKYYTLDQIITKQDC